MVENLVCAMTEFVLMSNHVVDVHANRISIRMYHKYRRSTLG